MNFVDSQLSKSPFPTFFQLIYALKNFELLISSYKEEKGKHHNLAFRGIKKGGRGRGRGRGRRGRTRPPKLTHRAVASFLLMSGMEDK